MADPRMVFILLGVFFFLIFAGMHIGIAVLAASLVTCFAIGVPLQTMALQVFKSINVYSLMAVPFFIIAGEVMMRGGITERLVGLSKALVGWLRGSLAIVNVVASVFFGTISGSSAADTASVGAMMIPMMEKDGYDVDYAAAVTMASSIEGMLIPPSHNMVIFALAAGNVSIARLFLGGVVPGLLLAFVLATYCFVVAIIKKHPKGDKFHFPTVWKELIKALPGLGTVLIVVIGVIGGIFTATEAAAVAVVYSFIVGIFFYKEIKIKELPDIFRCSIKTISIILLLIAGSGCFSWLVAYLGVSKVLASWLLSITSSKILIILMINAFLIICGCLMDMAALILITTPILLPVAISIGMDPVHYCSMMILNLGIGLITPPVGNTLFIASAITGRSIGQLSKAMVPFFVMMAIALFLITFIPEITLTLPSLVLD